MKQEHKTFLLRVPKDLKDWIDKVADEQQRSINKQIVYYLYQTKESYQVEDNSKNAIFTCKQ